MKQFLTWCAVALALAACASRPEPADDVRALDAHYPSGSIRTAEQADRALAEADAVSDRLHARFDAEQRRCEDVFLANRCLERARDVERFGEHIVDRVELEAHDLRRALDARAHERQRAEELQRQAEEERQRPERERQAMEAAQARERDAQAREEEAVKGEDTARKAQADTATHLESQEKRVEGEQRERPAKEQSAEKAFQGKQEEAAAYAKSRAEDKQANEAQRAERRAEREAKARQDAEEAARAAARAANPSPP